jgi:hypothetical protein
MRIKWLYAILIVCFSILPSISSAFPNEPSNFRSVKWGANISTLSDFKLIQNHSDYKLYIRNNEKLSIGSADIRNIFYGFYKDRFFLVKIEFIQKSNFMKIKETVSQQYGKAARPNEFLEKYGWVGKILSIVLNFNEISEKGSLTYYYIPLWKEKETDDKKDARSGIKDL